ncbi:alpha/beta fold hydrolase [Streptomyces scabiei]|nr:alpha/beta fold hydrolase [Streptomyces sp. LBUM 1480]
MAADAEERGHRRAVQPHVPRGDRRRDERGGRYAGLPGAQGELRGDEHPEELINGLTLAQKGDTSPELLSRVVAPTLIVLGDDDILLSPGRGRDLAALFPKGRCEIMSNAGHVPYLDDPETFQTLVLKFVEEAEAHV